MRTALRLLFLLYAIRVLAADPVPGKPISLPISFEANRFFAEPVTKTGIRLHLYTDSGGGLFVTPDTVKKLSLKLVTRDDSRATRLPPFQSGKAIPTPLANDGLIPVFDGKLPPHSETWSGLLGQQWFAGRTWTWDYIHHQLLFRANGDLPKAGHRVQLAFKNDNNGKRELNFPRISITVDGRTFDVLFDTGATTFVKLEALNQIGDGGPAARATSFIIQDVFDDWHKRHPGWKMVEEAEDGTNQPMIQVPEVEVAGFRVGPVWFTRRPNESFHKFMSQFMDKQVDGALGGSGLQYFIVTIDYPDATAVFQHPEPKRSATSRP
jgi:hypothetical protein